MSEVAQRRGREGSRWYNERPASDDVAAWWRTIPLHEGMPHDEYIGGVTLIQSTEKSDEVVGWDSSGLPEIRERRDLVFVPYVKVETRVAYFWQLCEKRDWIGEIEPVITPGAEQIGLPPGYFRYTAAKPDGKNVSFVGCSMRMRAYERVPGHEKGRVVLTPSPGSKIVSTATKWDVDQNALMKAETGAVGRALGMGGILVVPGSGVATAEDMLDDRVPAGAAEPELPAETAVEPEQLSDEQLRERAQALIDQLAEADPARLEAFREWARGRKLGTLAEAQGAALKGVVRKLERELDAVAEAVGAS